MAQQISIEAALAAYQKRCAELFHANVLLEARVSELETEAAGYRERWADDPGVKSGPSPAEE